MNPENNTKQILIEAAYHMILEKGAENIRVRDLAKRVGCSPAALYKHFESLDYLLALASVRFLQPYIEELEENLKNADDIIEAQINAWRLFNKYAFMHPYIFLNLFWGTMRNELESILQEYLKMYPVFVEGSNTAMFYCSIFSGCIEDRDYIWFRRAAAEGRLSYDDAEYVSQINCLIARGLLSEYINSPKDSEAYQKAVAHCNSLIEKNIRLYLI